MNTKAILSGLMAAGVAAQAVDFNDYKANFTATYLKPLAKDLGALLGGGTFHTAAMLGFPGVEAEGQVVLLNGGESPLLSGQLFGAPYARVEVGVPLFPVNVQARALSYSGVTVMGGGAKVGLPLLPSLPGAPSVRLAVLGTVHLLTFSSGADDLKATVYSAHAVVSVGLPFVPVEPYIGAGWDATSLTARLSGVELPVSETGMRAVAGLNVSLFPFTFVSGEIGLANATTTFGLRAGVRL